MKDSTINILLVEDDEVDVMNVQRAFKKNHINNTLHIAGNGLEALAMLRGEDGADKIVPPPKIILLDLNMPKMNGIEFLQALRSDPELESTSVFVLTTSGEERDIVAAYKLNVAGYVLKPVALENFIQALSTLDLYWSLIEMP
ncbi:Two-component transcriptional response regulator, LuxR family [hydrothermal vent metagenome]|uniref:Two-component transcriptional response regulator, LuxR family n=1 Tax=hydrothermal vent metagenome TaxID=652676 RepID=A0A3B1A0Z5_9ZZZZ